MRYDHFTRLQNLERKLNELVQDIYTSDDAYGAQALEEAVEGVSSVRQLDESQRCPYCVDYYTPQEDNDDCRCGV